MRDMNWKRGLFRTWFVGTAIWIATVVYMVGASCPVAPAHKPLYTSGQGTHFARFRMGIGTTHRGFAS